MFRFPGLLHIRLFNDFVSIFLPRLVYDCRISLLELSAILRRNCVEFKLCFLMVWLVMCLCMNKAIA